MSPNRVLLVISNTIFGIFELILSLQLAFTLLGANPAQPFVAWIGRLAGNLSAPFSNILPNYTVLGRPLETAVLIALVVYALIGYLIAVLLEGTSPRRID